jgi:hypothetical protein
MRRMADAATWKKRVAAWRASGRQIDVVAPELLGDALDRQAIEHLGDRQVQQPARRGVHPAGREKSSAHAAIIP